MLRSPLFVALGLAAGLSGCGDNERTAPSDDPADWAVDTSVTYRLEVSEPRWLVPAANIPAGVRVQASNNNLDLIFHGDRLFFAWRTSENHFASAASELHVLSSADDGATWDHELTVAITKDVREPRFLSFGGVLHLYYFEGGSDPFSFDPQKQWRVEREGLGKWSAPSPFGLDREVPWDLKVRGGRPLLSSYIGNHYRAGPGTIDVFLKSSPDGRAFAPLVSDRPVSYKGGVSEVAFEIDEDGGAWLITRNEDGDDSGFGSHLCRASREDLARWDCPSKSSPERYDSPKMFRHGKDVFLIARRDVGGPYDQGLDEIPFEERRRRYQLAYWGRPKRTAIYRIDREARAVVHVLDLPSAGDTAYPAVVRTGLHTFLVGNYTSPLSDPDRSWLDGQLSEQGTQIYTVTLTFVQD